MVKKGGKNTPMMTATPTQLIIFGITGDLAGRMLIPALYRLAAEGRLPETFSLIGITRRGMTIDELHRQLRTRLEENNIACQDAVLDILLGNARILTMDLSDVAAYERLKQELDGEEARTGVCMTRLFYLSVPAQSFSHIAGMLHKAELHAGCQHGTAESRLMIEKPFGYDYESAKELVEQLNRHFTEEQIYRIDHFVAKRQIWELLEMRQHSSRLEELWNASSIRSVRINALEEIDIQGRGDFYEQTGALRDMIQSHLLQLMALVGMSMPQELNAAGVRRAKQEFLESVVPIKPNEVSTYTLRAQYGGYRDEVADKHTVTETYALIALRVDAERWRDTAFVLHSGKALEQKDTSVRIATRSGGMFDIRMSEPQGMSVQPPGGEDELSNQLIQELDAHSRTAVTGTSPDLEGYERVFYDAMTGDQRMFVSGPEVLAAWRVIDSVLKAWVTPHDIALYQYDKKGRVPTEAEQVAAQHGVDL